MLNIGPTTNARTFERRNGSQDTVYANDFGKFALTDYDALGRRVKETRVLTPTSLGDGQYIGRTTVGAPAATPLPDPAQGGGDGLIDTRYEYDANGALAALIDDNGNKSVWTYDNCGRKTAEAKGYQVAPALAEVNDGPTTISWTYNADGSVAAQTKEDGTAIEYSCDGAGRLEQIEVAQAAAGVIGTTLQTFAYDGLGRRTKSTDNNEPGGAGDDVVATWYYDTLGRQVEETLKIGASGTARAVTTHYSGAQRSALVYPNARRIDYAYFPGGALRSIRDSGTAAPAVSPIATYDYIGNRVLVRSMQNGVNLDLRNGADTWYDSLGRPMRYAHRSSRESGYPVKIGFDHAYDRVGNKLSQLSLHDPKDSQRYAYDSADRLTDYVRADFTSSDRCDPSGQTWSDLVRAQKWNLDGLGNWTHLLTRTSSGDTTETRTRTTFNEYDQVGAASQAYDDNGNLTGDGNQTYQWDAFNRLRVAFNSQGTTLGVYLYDAGNRRVRKTATIQGSTSSTDYYYTGWQTVEERDNPSIPARQYVDGGLYIDEHLQMNVNTDADAYTTGTADARCFYHSNTLYSIYGLSDASGAIVEAYEYDPYGKHTLITNSGAPVSFTAGDQRSAEGASQHDNWYLHAGRESWGEIGAYGNRLRIAASYSGRFVSRDLVRYMANLYCYVGDRPLFSLDPSGLAEFVPPPDPSGGHGYDIDYLDRWRNEDPKGFGKWLDNIHAWWAQASGLGQFFTDDPLAAYFLSHFLYDGGKPLELKWSKFSGSDIDVNARTQITEVFSELRDRAEHKARASDSLYRVYVEQESFRKQEKISSTFHSSIGKYYRSSRHSIRFAFCNKSLDHAQGTHFYLLTDKYDWENNDMHGPSAFGVTLWDAQGFILERYGQADFFDIRSSGKYRTEYEVSTGLVITPPTH